MTLANLTSHHARLVWLASGDFKERDFDFEIAASDNDNGEKGEKGWSTMGEMNSARKALIQQDAARTLKIFYKKYPQFNPVVIGATVEEVKEAEKTSDVSYSDMTKAQLTALANDKKLDISNASTKDDLVVILEESSESA